MIAFEDSFIGTNTALVGTAIESCSVPCGVWSSVSSNLFRNTTALQASTGSYAAQADIDDPLTSMPTRLVAEADLYALDAGSNTQSSSVSLVVRGTYGGPDASVAARVTIQRTPSSFTTYYTLDTPADGTIDLYTDTTYYTDFVKRKIDVDLVNMTYGCYADDVLINSGSFSSDTTLDTLVSMGAVVFIQRSGATASASRVRNFYAEMYDGTTPPAEKFWTDFVNTYEVA